MKDVPTIDISNVTDDTLAVIDMACRDHGFFKLVGHGLNDLLDQMWQQTELFFAQPQAFKDALMRPEDSAFGYFNREMTKLKRDQKETFDYHGLPPKPNKTASNDYWPDTHENVALAEFEALLKRFYSANTALAEKTLASYG